MPEPTDFTLWEYEELPGFPPEAEPGYFLGFAEGHRPFILTWHPAHNAWVGVGFDPDCWSAPFLFLGTDEKAAFIKSYTRLPLVAEAAIERGKPFGKTEDRKK